MSQLTAFEEIIQIPEARPYQSECIEEVSAKFKEGKKCILVVLPGAAGKTIIAAIMIKSSVDRKKTVLFKAHRRELIKQACDKFKRFGLKSGMIMSGQPENLMLPIQIASIQTLQNRKLPPANFIFVDEAHRALSPQYLKILNEYKKQGAYIVGFTGTPFRTNKRERLADLFDDYVANIKASELINQGYITPAKGYGSGRISSKGMKVHAGEFRDAELMKAFDTEEVYKNLIINYKKHAEGKKTIVFCCNVPHSIKCTEAFLNAGYAAAHIDGNTPQKERDEIVKKFGSGEIQVLLNYGILAEGFDVPDTECVILALATKSKIKYYQACWRGQRKSHGKDYYIVIDMADNWERFGPPDEDIEVSLEAECDTDSNGVAPVKVCPCCSYMSHASAKKCNDCGEEYKKTKKEIEEEEFIELKRENKIRKWKNYTGKDWYKVKDEDLEEFAKIKGYKPFWVKRQREERAAGLKMVKIENFAGSKEEYYKEIKTLQTLYFSKKPIDASKYVFLEETKGTVTFKAVSKQENEVNQSVINNFNSLKNILGK